MFNKYYSRAEAVLEAQCIYDNNTGKSELYFMNTDNKKNK